MELARAGVVIPSLCLVLGAGAFGLAGRMTALGASGVEDIPPPFILVAGMAGTVVLCISVLGFYPWRESARRGAQSKARHASR